MDLTLFLNHACNLRCTYCYNGEKFTRRMTSDTMRRSVELMLARGPTDLDVSFFGGEPMLEFDLIRETVEYVERRVTELGKTNRPRFILNTNSTLFTDESIEFIRGRNFSVYTSVDGPREDHNKTRLNVAGRGSFDTVMDGLSRMRGAAIPFQILCVVNTENAPRLGAALEALAPLGARMLTFSPNFRDDWTDESIQGLRRGLRDAGAVWMDLFRAGKATHVEPFQNKIISHLQGANACPSRCQLGGREFAVSPAGNLYPCAQNVEEDRNHDLVIGTLDTGFDHDAMRRLQEQKNGVEETCSGCDIKHRCQSHCGCRHVALTGRMGQITAVLCEIESAFIDEADRVAEILFTEQCPAFIDRYYRKQWVPTGGAKIVRLRKSRDEAFEPEQDLGTPLS